MRSGSNVEKGHALLLEKFSVPDHNTSLYTVAKR